MSAVTASSDAEVAAAVAAHVRADQTFIDINSVSPALKQHGQQLIEAAGGRYVEAVVMAPVPPHALAVPMLLAGPSADAVARELTALGFAAQAVSTRVGAASTAIMCRSDKDCNARAVSRKFGHQIRHEALRGCLDQRNAHDAVTQGTQVVERGMQVFDIARVGMDVVEQQLPGRRQRRAFGRAIEQRGAQFCFQIPDLLADRARRDEERLGCLSQQPRARDLGEILQ